MAAGSIPPLPLACLVRNCHLALLPHGRAFVCAAGHSYDIARAGYVNLLQPQDRRSLQAGDSKAAVQARAALLDAGVGRVMLDRFVAQAASLIDHPGAVVADLGSGGGEALNALAGLTSIRAVGIDLSTAAADAAARRFPSLTWIVANADRRLPFMDKSVNLVISLNGRRNPAECARILAPGGRLLIAAPAVDDLAELREFVQGERSARDRGGALISAHQPFFSLLDRSTVRSKVEVGRPGLLALLQITYRGARTSAAARVAALNTLQLTMASDLFVFAAREPGIRGARLDEVAEH